MAAVPGVENAVVKAFEDENGQNYLCGYFVAGAEVGAEELRAQLKKTLPDYMIPRFFKRLDALPKNVNGKLDRTLLQAPGVSEYKANYRAPENELQRRICDAFETVLECGTVGLDDDFFRLGGDSINVLKLVECLADTALTPQLVLRGRTPEQIAVLIQAQRETTVQEGSHHQADPCAEYPLTDSQMGVYLECVNEPDTTMYNIPMCCELPRDVDLDRFCEAVGTVVSMHAAFGVTIVQHEGVPVMRVCPEYTAATVELCETDRKSVV